MNRSKIFCVIPAFNEEKTIAKVIQDVKSIVDEVVVVDDCSFDKTYEIAKQQGIIALRHIINRDQGAALETGNQYALRHGADIIVHFDADGQFIAEEIAAVVGPIIKGSADAVFGSRFLSKKSVIPWFKEKIIFPLARMANKILLGVDLTDPQSGFRALSKNATEKIIIEQDGKAHCSEILFKAHQLKLRIQEVPITVIYYDFGQKFSSGLTILKDLFFARLMK